MRKLFCVILALFVAAIGWACQPLFPGVPSGSPPPVKPQVPVLKEQLQLAVIPDPNTAICSADGRVLVVESDSGLLLLQNQGGSLKEVPIVLNQQTPVLDMALSADGGWLAIATARGLQVLSTADASLVSDTEWSQPVSQATVLVSQDGLNIACHCDNFLYLFHGPLLNLRWAKQPASQSVTQSLLMSSNGLTLVTVDDKLTVFSPDASAPLWQAELDGNPEAFAVSEDGVYIAVELGQSPSGGKLLLFERWVSEPTWVFDHQALATDLRFSPDGSWLALSTDQFYLFSSRQAHPVMQLQQAGKTALSNGRVLLIADQSLYAFHTNRPDLVTWRLPSQLASELTYVFSQSEWLYAINAEGLVFLVQLPMD